MTTKTQNTTAAADLIAAIRASATRKESIQKAARAAVGKTVLMPAHIPARVDDLLALYETLEDKTTHETFSLKASKVREDFRVYCTLLLAGTFEVSAEVKEKGKEPATVKMAARDALAKADTFIAKAAAQVRDAGRTPEEIAARKARNEKTAATAAAKKITQERAEKAAAGKGEISAANDEFAAHAAWLTKQLAGKGRAQLEKILAAAGYKLEKVEIPVRVHTMEG